MARKKISKIRKKSCIRCYRLKAFSLFHKRSDNKRKRRNVCAKCENEYARKWHSSNREARIGKMREWRTLNKEKFLLSKRSYNIRNREKLAEKSRKRYWSNPEKYRDISNQYRKSHLREHADAVRLRTHRKRANGGSFTIEQWEFLCNKYKNKCLCCKRKRKLTIDHIVPISRGGKDCIENIQPLCGTCNSIKHDKTIDYRPKEKTKKERTNKRIA